MKNPRAVFNGENGYDAEIEQANKILTKGKQYTITGCSIGSSHSTVIVGGRSYNSVLFNISISRLLKYFPNSFSYITQR